MGARLVLRDKPGAWMMFSSGGTQYRARLDPLWLGAERLVELLNNPRLVWQLLDEPSRIRAMMDDIFGTRTVVLLQDYAEAAGLGFDGLAALIRGLNNLDALEVDLFRMGVDVADWLDLEGPLSSRRMALVIRDLMERPETRIGAAVYDLLPIDKAGIVLAQIANGMSESKENHVYLKSQSELRAEAEVKAERAASAERMRKRW